MKGAGVGAGSVILTIPGKKIGLAIFTPVASAGYKAIPAIAYHLIDAYLGLDPINWRERSVQRISPVLI